MIECLEIYYSTLSLSRKHIQFFDIVYIICLYVAWSIYNIAITYYA